MHFMDFNGEIIGILKVLTVWIICVAQCHDTYTQTHMESTSMSNKHEPMLLRYKHGANSSFL